MADAEEFICFREGAEMNIEDKLFLDKFNPDSHEHSHLKIIDQEVCRNCKDMPCTAFCPARTYKYENDNLLVSYENCLECGSCHIGCPDKNIEWEYPRPGFGVSYRYG